MIALAMSPVLAIVAKILGEKMKQGAVGQMKFEVSWCFDCGGLPSAYLTLKILF